MQPPCHCLSHGLVCPMPFVLKIILSLVTEKINMYVELGIPTYFLVCVCVCVCVREREKEREREREREKEIDS